MPTLRDYYQVPILKTWNNVVVSSVHLFTAIKAAFQNQGKFHNAQTALKWARILWSDTMANEAGPPVAIYSKVSDLHTCMARQIYYQRFDIPMILHRTLTSFHLNYPPYVKTRAAQRGAYAFSTLFFFALSHFRSQVLNMQKFKAVTNTTTRNTPWFGYIYTKMIRIFTIHELEQHYVLKFFLM